MFFSKTGFWRSLRFSATGIIASVVYFGTYFLLLKCGIWYLVASVTAYAPTVIVKFALHKRWVFKNTDRHNTMKQAKRYVVVTFALFAINNATLYVFVEYLQIGEVVAPAIVNGLQSIASFLLARQIFSIK